MRNSYQIFTREKSGKTRSLALNIVKWICADENCNLTCCFHRSCQRIPGHILNLCKTPLHCPLYSKLQQLFQGLENVECNNRKCPNEPKCKGQLLTVEKWIKTPSIFLSASIFHASIIHQNSSAQIPLIWQCAWSHTTMHLFSSRTPAVWSASFSSIASSISLVSSKDVWQQDIAQAISRDSIPELVFPMCSPVSGSPCSRTCFCNAFSHLHITMNSASIEKAIHTEEFGSQDVVLLKSFASCT